MPKKFGDNFTIAEFQAMIDYGAELSLRGFDTFKIWEKEPNEEKEVKSPIIDLEPEWEGSEDEDIKSELVKSQENSENEDE